MKSGNKQKWLKVIEFIVVSFATWLDPSAGGLLFLLKLCFFILAAVQKEEPDQTDKRDRPPAFW